MDECVLDASNKGMWNNVAHKFLVDNMNETITHLDMSTNHISLESADLISSFLHREDSQLVGLSLVQTKLTVRAAKSIFSAVGKSKLKELYVDNNILTNESIKVLAESLENSPPLIVLSLNGCSITSEAASVLIPSLVKVPTLKHLRLESNSLFDPGAEAVANILKSTSITHLSLADNEIWLGGTTALLESIIKNRTIESLDISYNTINLELLGTCLVKTPTLTELSISGCKVQEGGLSGFLENLSSSSLKILIFDGLIYNQLPISWPKVKDSVFQPRMYFEYLNNFVRKSKTIQDLRLGFLDLDQINVLYKTFSETKPDQTLHLSIHDFGRTGNCWVFSFPDFSVMSPSSSFVWKTKLSTQASLQLSNIFQQAVFNDKTLDSLILQGISLNDSSIIPILDSLSDIHINSFDISNNVCGDNIIESLISFLTKNTIKELFIDWTNITDIGLQKLMKFFNTCPHSQIPKKISFTVKTDRINEMDKHALFDELGILLASNPPIESLVIDGTVSSLDVTALVEGLWKNSKLLDICIQSLLIFNYSSPDPAINDDIQKTYITLAETLHTSLAKRGSKCLLQYFKFPLLTDIFIYHEAIISKWPDIEQKLNMNREQHK